MAYFVSSFVLLLALNAFVAFGIAFYWQLIVIFTVMENSEWDGTSNTPKDLANPNGANNTFGRFIAGEIFPELRRKWLKAIGYVAVSFVTLFVVAGFLQVVAPDYLP